MKNVKDIWLLTRIYCSEFTLHIIVLSLVGLIIYVVQKFVCISELNIIKILGSVLAVMIGLFVYKAQKRVLSWDIRNRLICELDELYRHLQSNLEVLELMSVSKGKPSMMHLEKLRIDDHKTLTDAEIMKNMSKKFTSLVFPLTIRMRNYNITVDYLKKALEGNDKVLFERYINEMKAITINLLVNIEYDTNRYILHDVKKAYIEEKKNEKGKTELKHVYESRQTKKRRIIEDGVWGDSSSQSCMKMCLKKLSSWF